MLLVSTDVDTANVLLVSTDVDTGSVLLVSPGITDTREPYLA